MRCTTPRGHAERTKRLSLAICEGPDPAEHPPALGSQSPVPLAAPAQRLVCLAGKPTGSRRDGVSMMAGPSSTLYLTTLRRPARFSSAMPARGAHPHHRCVCTVHCVPRVALWQRPSTRDCGRPVSCARPGLAYGASSDHQPSGSGSRGGRATRHASTAVASAHVSARCGVAVALPTGERLAPSSAQLGAGRSPRSGLEPDTTVWWVGAAGDAPEARDTARKRCTLHTLPRGRAVSQRVAVSCARLYCMRVIA